MRTRRAYVVLALLSLALSAAALLAAVNYYHRSEAAQRSQGAVLEHRLCTTLDRLASLTPPSGSPGQNPSRAFDQQLVLTLAELGPDVGCTRRSS